MRRLRRWLCTISRRYKLRCICRAIGIVPYPWQRQFALTGSGAFPPGRRTGKTMAVMLHLLMMGDAVSMHYVLLTLLADPDWRSSNYHRVSWYHNEYHWLALICLAAGISVPIINIKSLGRRT